MIDHPDRSPEPKPIRHLGCCLGLLVRRIVQRAKTLRAGAPMLLLFSLLILMTSSGCQRFCWPACAPLQAPFPAFGTGLGLFAKPVPPPFVEPRKYSLFVSPEFPHYGPQRVLIVPTGTESGRYQTPIHFAESLSASLRSCGVAEVIFPPQLDCTMTVDRLLTGQFSEWEIAALSRAWHCDAILFVRVNQFQGFAPLKASVTAALVDANESMVVFAVDGNWDTSDPDIRSGFEHFVTNSAYDASESELKLQFQSPNRLFAYIGHQITDAWQRAKF